MLIPVGTSPRLIPDPDEVRRRLAVVLTEADLLRSQLKVSEKLTREEERLRRQCAEQEVSHSS